MKKIKPIITNLKKYRCNMFYRARFTYTRYYKKLSINENEILLEAFNGANINGNVYYLLLELCKNEDYKNYIKYISLKKNSPIIETYKEILGKWLNETELSKVKIVIRNSKEYCKVLAEAKYLINNVSFPTYFMRKPEQIYLNTWHGTPLKGLGRNIKDDPISIGNVQRNFMHATHLLFPNEYTFDIMRKDYMIEKFYNGKYILTGYPKNDIFFNKKIKKRIQNELNINDKKVIIYMPTWRDKEVGDKNNKQVCYIMHALYEMEKRLPSNMVVYVKLHHLTSGQINLDCFDKIREFPEEYETYEILNIADCLVTDYSSVMFDFANTNNKIILYYYDKEQYVNGRSMYFNIEDLPFSKTDDVKELCEEIKKVEKYDDYGEVRNKFCNYDSEYSSKKICEYIIKGKADKSMKIIDGETYHNNKENVLIFAGELQKNGITTSLKSLLNYVNLNEKNYILTFYKSKTEANKLEINEFNNKVDYFPMSGQKNLSFTDAIYQYLYFKLNINTKLIKKHINKIFKNEIERCFPKMKFDYAIHYTGYERQAMNLLGNMNSERIIYTHNNLIEENRTKKNIHVNSLKKAYEDYDKIIIVRESMRSEISNNIKKADLSKVFVIHNLNDIEGIRKKGNYEVKFDKDTYCNYEVEKLKEILDDENVIKFVNVARYSKEKGMERLIKAFQTYHNEHEKSYLIIIGGYGKNFENIKDIVDNQGVENVIIIKSLSNPYAIINRCDLFILASYYEGLPMTIMEALILNKPVVSTNITGPREFLKNGYGYLVENSEEGILEGMKKYTETGLKKLKKFDADDFNKEALKELYNVIK